MNPLPDRSNYSPLCHTHYLTPDQYFIVSSGQTLQATSWRLILQSSLLQRFTAESSRELSALRKLNNKQRQVSMFLFKFLIQFPFVSFLSTISILSLLPFSILSLLSSNLSYPEDLKKQWLHCRVGSSSLRPSFSSNYLFTSFSIPSLLPFSILSLLPFLITPNLSTIPSCLSDQFSVLLR